MDDDAEALLIHKTPDLANDFARGAQRLGVNATRDEIQRLLDNGQGIIARHRHPALADALHHLVRRGLLVAILPGVYAATEHRQDFATRLRALALWDPNAVVVGRAAARLTFWPGLEVPQVEAAVSTRKGRRHGWEFTRRRVPSELVVEVAGVRCTSPALTALDLTLTDLAGNAIDTVLRTRAATLAQLHEALASTPARRGTADRRRLLLDSRDQPWSEAERGLHRILRAAGITGWEGNWPYELASGLYWIDAAFPEVQLAVEVDGWEFHNTKEAFEHDRRRQNDLVLAGWTVLRFTAVMIRDEPELVVRTVLAALVMLSRR